MTTNLLPAVEIEPAGKANATLLFFHGLGADGHDFESIVPLFKLPPAVRLRCIFPHAPKRAVSINGGAVMPAWFDVGIDDLRTAESSDMAGVKSAARTFDAFVERELARGIPGTRVVVGGFSQGGALSGYAAPRFTKPLGGLIALSTFLVGGKALESEASMANKALPAFLGHGTRDPLVPIARGKAMRERLAQLGGAVEWHEYPMQHEVCMEEIDHLSSWLARVLA